MHKSDLLIARIMVLLRDSLFFEVACPDTDLIESGMIDSAGFMDLFVALEDEFGIEIEANDLNLNHFRTVECLAKFVAAKQGVDTGR